MIYSLKLSQKANRQLEKLSIRFQKKIREKLDGLQDNPRPSGCKKLRGEKGVFRLRMGDYRIVYKVDDYNNTILIIKIGDRKDIYNK